MVNTYKSKVKVNRNPIHNRCVIVDDELNDIEKSKVIDKCKSCIHIKGKICSLKGIRVSKVDYTDCWCRLSWEDLKDY